METYKLKSIILNKQFCYVIEVLAGFNLWGFCQENFDDGMYCHDAEWAAFNPGFNKDKISVGQEIRIPFKFNNRIDSLIVPVGTVLHKKHNGKVIHEHNFYKVDNNHFCRIGLDPAVKRSIFLDFSRIESVDLSNDGTAIFVMYSGKEHTFTYLNKEVQKDFEVMLTLFFSHKR